MLLLHYVFRQKHRFYTEHDDEPKFLDDKERRDWENEQHLLYLTENGKKNFTTTDK